MLNQIPLHEKPTFQKCSNMQVEFIVFVIDRQLDSSQRLARGLLELEVFMFTPHRPVPDHRVQRLLQDLRCDTIGSAEHIHVRRRQRLPGHRLQRVRITFRSGVIKQHRYLQQLRLLQETNHHSTHGLFSLIIIIPQLPSYLYLTDPPYYSLPFSAIVQGNLYLQPQKLPELKQALV